MKQPNFDHFDPIGMVKIDSFTYINFSNKDTGLTFINGQIWSYSPREYLERAYGRYKDFNHFIYVYALISKAYLKAKILKGL